MWSSVKLSISAIISSSLSEGGGAQGSAPCHHGIQRGPPTERPIVTLGNRERQKVTGRNREHT
ncbi:hypothetical protein GCM10010462_12970 [Microbacterium dextranolyticum]|uniref:Uncharacterized protein n=1 Tax=Microbacterium dextranolyticum TaxID=36806 RepID=A0A9W6HIT4_9MICO|nr:hypothetical protein GCM10017591_00270 [Microbacterium dextranolyticum]